MPSVPSPVILRRVLKWAIGVSLVLLLLVGGLVLFRDTLFCAYAEQALAARTGLKTEIGSLNTRLGSGAITVRGVRLYNGPEFGGGLFVEIPELVVELDSRLASEGRLRFRKLLLDLAQVNVVRSHDGQNNLEKLERSLNRQSSQTEGPSSSRPNTNAVPVFAGIDFMKLSIGEVRYTDLKRPKRSRRIEVEVRDEIAHDLRTEEDLQTWAGAFLFRVFLQEAVKRAGERRRSGREADEVSD